MSQVGTDGAQQRQVRPHLSLRQEVGHERTLHCIFQLTVLKDEEGRFPPQLQGHLLHPLRRHFHHLKKMARIVSAHHLHRTVYYPQVCPRGTFLPVGTLPVNETLATVG